MTEQFPVTFAELLRRLRLDAGLTQEELAAVAWLSARSVSDLERGVTVTARRDTARLLAQALGLSDAEKGEFELVALGRATPNRSLAWRAAVRMGAVIAPEAAGFAATPGFAAPPDIAATLSSAYQAALPRPILAEGDAEQH